MPITTFDCKKKILEFFADNPRYETTATGVADIKRVSKKTVNGTVVRRFTHLNRDADEDDFSYTDIYVVEENNKLTGIPHPPEWTWYFYLGDWGTEWQYIQIYPRLPGEVVDDYYVAHCLVNKLDSSFEESSCMYFIDAENRSEQEVVDYLLSKGLTQRSFEERERELWGE